MKTYITQKLVNLLKLKPVDKNEILVNSFGSKSGTLMDTCVYNICLRANDGSNCYIKGSAVQNICAPLCDRQVIDVVKTQFPFVEKFTR